jgi:hypothetical protein
MVMLVRLLILMMSSTVVFVLMILLLFVYTQTISFVLIVLLRSVDIVYPALYVDINSLVQMSQPTL